MASKDRELLEMALGALMAQAAVCEFMVKSGAIKRGPLIEHLAAKRVGWESTATPNALFAIDVLSSLIAGRQPPTPPASLH